jgi:phosphatidylglycerophosphate synthase
MADSNKARTKAVSLPLSAGARQWAVPVVGLSIGAVALGWTELAAGILLLGTLTATVLVVGVDIAASVNNRSIGWASRVTQARLALVALLAAALFEPSVYRDAGWIVAGLALFALVLDGVDGFLARRLDECSSFGARFDMEVDAALIMVLCMGAMAAGLAGPWVLLLGLMRYLFLMAGRWFPWLDEPLPESLRRKMVCVWQVAALLMAISPLMSGDAALLMLISALAGLVYSFAVDVWWLYRNRPNLCPQRGLS